MIAKSFEGRSFHLFPAPALIEWEVGGGDLEIHMPWKFYIQDNILLSLLLEAQYNLSNLFMHFYLYSVSGVGPHIEWNGKKREHGGL